MMISFIILSHKKTPGLEKLIGKIRESFPSDEIVMVNNCKINLVENQPKKNFKSIIANETTTGHARNLGAIKANGDILYFIDGDVKLSSKWGDALSAIKARKKIDIIGGRVISYSNIYNLIPIKYKYLIGEKNLSKKFRIIKYNYLSGCNLIINRHIFNKVGGFPEDMGHLKNKLGLNEDVFLQDKARMKGYETYFDPNLEVIHNWEGTLNDLLKRCFYQGKFNYISDKKIYSRPKIKRLILSYLIIFSKLLLRDKLPRKFEFDYYKGLGYINGNKNT